MPLLRYALLAPATMMLVYFGGCAAYAHMRCWLTLIAYFHLLCAASFSCAMLDERHFRWCHMFMPLMPLTPLLLFDYIFHADILFSWCRLRYADFALITMLSPLYFSFASRFSFHWFSFCWSCWFIAMTLLYFDCLIFILPRLLSFHTCWYFRIDIFCCHYYADWLFSFSFHFFLLRCFISLPHAASWYAFGFRPLILMPSRCLIDIFWYWFSWFDITRCTHNTQVMAHTGGTHSEQYEYRMATNTLAASAAWWPLYFRYAFTISRLMMPPYFAAVYNRCQSMA